MTTSVVETSSQHQHSSFASAYAASAYPSLGISVETCAADPTLSASLVLRQRLQAARNRRNAARCGGVWIEKSEGAQ